MTKRMFIISLGLLAPFFGTAQEEQTTQQTPQENEKQYPATIEGQYDQLVEKAGNWEKYKLIKKESIYSFKRFMLDSLKAQKQVLREKLDTISSQSSQIKQLNQRISSLESDLDKEKNRNNSIEFLGMTIEKGLYSAVVWGIIIVGAILFEYLSRFRIFMIFSIDFFLTVGISSLIIVAPAILSGSFFTDSMAGFIGSPPKGSKPVTSLFIYFFA